MRHDSAAVRDAQGCWKGAGGSVVSGSRRALQSDTLSGSLRVARLRACNGASPARGRARLKTRRNEAREALTRERARQR